MTYDELVKLEEYRSFSLMELEDDELIEEFLRTEDEDWLATCAIEMTIRVEQPDGPPADPRLVELYRLFQQCGQGVTVNVPQDVIERVRAAAGSQPSNSASAPAGSQPK